MTSDQGKTRYDTKPEPEPNCCSLVNGEIALTIEFTSQWLKQEKKTKQICMYKLKYGNCGIFVIYMLDISDIVQCLNQINQSNSHDYYDVVFHSRCVLVWVQADIRYNKPGQ